MDKLLKELVEVAELAGAETLKFYQKIESSDIETKSDDTPVTKADLAASKVIVEELAKRFPDIPSLSEESPQDIFEKRHSFEKYFLIDPIDGTKEFIRGSGEYTVNIAYIENSHVLAGVVGLPVLDEVFWGSLEGSFVKRKGVNLKLPLVNYDEAILRVVSSKSHPTPKTDEYIKNLKNKFPEVESLQFGSSLKICKVAEGVADLNPRLGGTSEWDIAAAHAVLLGAGGDVVKIEDGEQVTYNKESLTNPFYEARRKELLNISLF